MTQGVVEVLPFAVGVAISPLPIIALILMLFSVRARTNGPLFLIGWVGGLAVLAGVAFGLADAAEDASGDNPPTVMSWVTLALGLLLLLLSARSFQSRPEPDAPAELPGWMAGIDAAAPQKALLLGALLAAAKPKNVLLTIGAASSLAQSGATGLNAAVALVAFVALASATIAGPVAYHLVGGSAAEASLDTLKAWLTQHFSVVMATLLLVFGTLLTAKGLAAIFG